MPHYFAHLNSTSMSFLTNLPSMLGSSQRPTFNTSVVMMSINEDAQDESVCRSVLTDTSTSTADIQRGRD